MADASLGTAVLRTRLDTSGLKSGFSQAESDTHRAMSSISSQFTQLGASLTGIGTKLTMFVTTPLAAIGGMGIRSAQQLETFSASLRVLVGDAERADKAFEQLYAFDGETLFDWRTLSDATRILAGFGTEAEDLVPTLRQIGEIAAGTQSDLASLAEIYGRIRLTGRVTMQEINSLAQRGVPIIQELAKQYGIAESEVASFVSTGRVGFPQIERAFASMTSEGGRFFGMMSAQTDTSEGRLSNLLKTFEQMSDIVGQRLLPIFDGVVNRLTGLAQGFLNLDEGTQQLIVSIAGVAAAIGPVTLAFGGLFTLIGKIPAALQTVSAGFVVLRSAMAFLAGPAGLIILAATAAVTLAGAIAWNADSLEKAVGRVGNALSSGDADSLSSAIGDVVEKLSPSSPLRQNLVGLQGELRRTGEVGEEVAAQIKEALAGASLEIAAAPIRAELSALNAQIAALGATGLSAERSGAVTQSGAVIGGGGNTSEFLANRQQQLDQALMSEGFQPGDIVFQVDAAGRLRAVPVLPSIASGQLAVPLGRISDVIAAAVRDANADIQAIEAAADTSAIGERLAELEAQRAAAQARLDALLAESGGGSNEPPPNRTPPTPTGKPPRTVDDVLNELAAAGTAANRLAAFEGTPEAVVEAARARVRLIDGAIRELITDFYGKVTQEELAGLRARREAAQREINLYQQTVAIAAKAERRGGTAPFQELDDLAAAALAIQEKLSTRSLPPGWTPFGELDRMAETARLVSEKLDSRAVPPDWTPFGELDVLAAAAAAAQEKLDTRAYPAGWTPFGELDALAETARLVREKLDVRSLPPGWTPFGELDALAAAAKAVRDKLDARSIPAGWTPFGEVDAAAESLATSMRKLEARAFPADWNPFAELDAAAASLAKAIGRRPWDPFADWSDPRSQNAPSRFSDDSSDRMAAYRRAADEQARVIQTFAETVASAGFRFTENLIDAIRNGDVGAAFKAVLGAGQSIFGAADLGSIPFLGGSLSIGSLIASAIGLLGSLIGGGRGEEERRRQEQQARQARSVPAVNINFTMNQENRIEASLAGANLEATMRRVTVTAMEDFWTRSGIEARLAKLGV